MLTNSQIKHIISLKQKKFRTEHQQFIVEGIKVVKEFLKSDYSVSAVYCLEETANELSTFSKVAPTVITEIQLQKISSLETPNKVLAVASIPKVEFNFENSQNKLSLALDGINDPGNLGTIIRTAAWFGIETIICSENTVDAWNAKVVQSSMGALFSTRIIYADLKKIVAGFNAKRIPVYATTLDGKNTYKSDLSSNGLIVIGSESHGVSQDLLSIIDLKLLIPSYASGSAESLNAALATAIVCSEFRRRTN